MNGADVREDIPYTQRGEPVFEVIIQSSLVGCAPLHHLKIWGDGHMEGFESLANGNAITIANRFPMMLEQVITPIRDYVEDVVLEIDRLAPREGGGG